MQRRRKTTKEERVCSICSQHFAKAEHLDRHFRSHTKERPFRCQFCAKSFARQYVDNGTECALFPPLEDPSLISSSGILF